MAQGRYATGRRGTPSNMPAGGRATGEGPEDRARHSDLPGSDPAAEDASMGKSGPTVRYTFRRHWKRPQGNEE